MLSVPQVFDELPLFADLTLDERKALASVTQVYTFPSLTLIQPQNSMPESLFGVLGGGVELRTVEHDGGTATNTIVTQGMIVNLLAVVSASATLNQAMTTMPTKVAVIPATQVRELIDTNHAFCRAVLANVTAFSRSLVRKLNGQKMRTASQLLALWLLENAKPDGSVIIPFEKRTLASVVGTTPENLSRAFVLLAGAVRG